MITRNLHNYFMSKTNSWVMVKTMSGGSADIDLRAAYVSISNLSTSLTGQVGGNNCATIRIGSGTTDPSFEDYNLESMIDVAPKNVVMAARDGLYTNTYTIITATFLNETDSDWVVTEVGEYLATSTSDASAAILLAREVFDPVTVKPGQTFSVSMKLF